MSNDTKIDDIEFEINESELGSLVDDDTDKKDSKDIDGIQVEIDESELSEFTKEDNNTEVKFEGDLSFDSLVNSNVKSTISSDEIDKEIEKLTAELGMNNKDTYEYDKDTSNIADSNGTILDKQSLLNDDYKVVSRDNDFISPTGEIVVMDVNDNDDNFKLIYIDIEKIAIVKRIRNSTNVEDLVKSIKSTGLLKPVDVAPTSANGVYVLLDGYRRILACARAGKRRIPCVVNTRVNVPEIPVLEALYNHSKPYSIREMIDYIDYLEKQKGIMSASMIEYLLQMNSGDYTKLKDILNDNDDDIVSRLMNGQYNIEAAFKKLEQRRKKESADEKDVRKANKVYEDASESGAENIAESGETGDENGALSDEEINGLAINASNLDEIENESLADLVKNGDAVPGFKPHKQDPKYRERLDPTLRKSVLVRDENTCKICEAISGMEFTEVLDVHHIHEVYLGGTDDIKNLITACTVCHKLIHLHGRGELYMRPIEELSEKEQKRFKKIVALGTIIREDMANKGMNKEQLKKVDNAESIGRTKPGTGQEAG